MGDSIFWSRKTTVTTGRQISGATNEIRPIENPHSGSGRRADSEAGADVGELWAGHGRGSLGPMAGAVVAMAIAMTAAAMRSLPSEGPHELEVDVQEKRTNILNTHGPIEVTYSGYSRCKRI